MLELPVVIELFALLSRSFVRAVSQTSLFAKPYIAFRLIMSQSSLNS